MIPHVCDAGAGPMNKIDEGLNWNEYYLEPDSIKRWQL
jgi:hypothetical protein